MKATIIIALTALTALTSTAQAGYRIVIPMEQSKGGALPNGSINITPRTPGLPVENWKPAEPIYGEWVNENDIYGCLNWTPISSAQPIGLTFQQTADDCKQDQTRTVQGREQETTTLAYRNVGQPTTATRTLVAQSSRQATGTQENWQPTEPVYSDWINTGNISGCSNWAPAASTILKDEAFNQTATDCNQYQTRTRQDREQETTTLAYRNLGAPVTMGQNISAISSRTALGTKETWVQVEPTYTEWTNKGDIYACSKLVPDASTIEGGMKFFQSASGCSQDQTRSVQKREQESKSLVYRNVGEPISEVRKQTNITATREVAGTMQCWYSTTEYTLVLGNNRLFKISGSFRPTTGTTTDGYLYSGWYYYTGSFVGTIGGETRHKLCKRTNK